MALADNKAKIQALLDGINALPEAGSGEPADPVLQEKTVSPATSSQVVTADAGYDGLSKVTVNAMPTATQATPGISVSSAGLITASATQSAGYVAAGTKSATEQLTVQAAQTITPGTEDVTIAAGRYLTGAQTIKGDENLVEENIRAGVTIFGVQGTLEEGGSESEAQTCMVEISDESGREIDVVYGTADGVVYDYVPAFGFLSFETTPGSLVYAAGENLQPASWAYEFTGDASLVTSATDADGYTHLNFYVGGDCSIVVRDV